MLLPRFDTSSVSLPELIQASNRLSSEVLHSALQNAETRQIESGSITKARSADGQSMDRLVEGSAELLRELVSGGSYRAFSIGKLTVNVEPLPSSLQTDTRPPNISVKDLTM